MAGFVVISLTLPCYRPRLSQASHIPVRSAVLRVVLGGIGLLIGPIAPSSPPMKAPAMQDERHFGMGIGALAMLPMTSRTSDALIIALTPHRG